MISYIVDKNNLAYIGVRINQKNTKSPQKIKNPTVFFIFSYICPFLSQYLISTVSGYPVPGVAR
jgi:hypothetical protein